MNRAFAAVFTLAGLTVGAWFGEDLHLFDFHGLILTAACLGVGALVGVVTLWPVRPATAIVQILPRSGCLVMFVVGVLMGDWEVRRAYADCVAQGGALRLALQAHRDQYGRFPEFLSELEAPRPGWLVVRGSLLHYRLTPEGYFLWLPCPSPFYVSQATENRDFWKTK